MAGENANWWQTGIIYQIYPRSFQDSNHDGVGDLRGIIHRLPYLTELGVDAIWLSPIFTSPMADFGYDIADYTDVDPLFGNLADLDSLIEAAHRHQLKLILDLVPNHTSDQHPWFVESKTSRNNPKRDWFIWRDPAPDGGPPNNWLSEFGGSAWEFDPNTNQYYYHTFLSAQPDLNWRNPAVRNAMHDVMRFWLRRGVDGFRVDAVWYLIKDDQFRDNPLNPDFRPGGLPRDALIPLYTADLPEVHDAISGMRRVLDEFPDRVLLGEIYLPIERLVAYYGRDLEGVHFPYNFALLTAKWEARSLARLIDEYEAALPSGGWPNWVLGNHDRPRLATRIGLDQARVAAMLLMTLRGTPTLYYGDEIGMQQAAILPEQVRRSSPVAVRNCGYALAHGRHRPACQREALHTRLAQPGRTGSRRATLRCRPHRRRPRRSYARSSPPSSADDDALNELRDQKTWAICRRLRIAWTNPAARAEQVGYGAPRVPARGAPYPTCSARAAGWSMRSWPAASANRPEVF